MARCKLSATAVLLQVYRLSAEANGPTDLLQRVNNIDEQHMAARDGGVGAHTATRMYRGNNFVDPNEYSDGEVVNAFGDGDGDRNRMRARRMERMRAKTRTELANGKTTNSAGRKRRRLGGFRNNNAHDAYDEIAARALSKPLGLDPIDIGDSTNSTISSTNTNSTANPPPTLPRGTINSTPDIDSDPTPDQDPELDHFRTEHIFDPHYNGFDVIEVENEMSDGGATFEYDETNFKVDFGSFGFDLSSPVSFSPDSRSRESGKKSKSSSSAAAAAETGLSSKSSKSSKSSEAGGDDDDDNDGGESPKSSKRSKDNWSASHKESRRQRYRALRKNGRNIRGDGEVDEDRMAALREEEDPSLQGVVAVIAAHQRREDRQRQKKLQRRRNRTPEEKARDRALATSARRR